MNKILLPLTAVALCFSAQQALAATDSAQGTAKAKIIAPITIAAVTAKPMNFGTMLKPASDDSYTVQLSTASVRTCSDNDQCVSDTENTHTAGEFTITSGDARSATITIPTGLTISGAGDVSAIKFKLGASGTETAATNAAQSINLEATTQTLYVGGTLSVTEAATVGEHEGNYTVTLNY